MIGEWHISYLKEYQEVAARNRGTGILNLQMSFYQI